jgi:DNA primase
MSGKFIDFEAVKASKSIEDAVSFLGLEMVERNGQLRSTCPICGDEGERIFVVTPKKNKFYCFKCEAGGDQIALVAKVKEIGMREAAFELMGTVPEEREQKRPKSSEGFQPLDYLQPDHDAVEAIGFCTTLAEKVGIGYAPRGMHRGLVAVPVRDPNGTLLGYIGINDAKLPTDFQPPD